MDQADLYFEKTGTDGELSFKITGTDADNVFSDGLTFVPFNTLNDERYGIYWYFQAGDEGTSEDKILSEKEEEDLPQAFWIPFSPDIPSMRTMTFTRWRKRTPSSETWRESEAPGMQSRAAISAITW